MDVQENIPEAGSVEINIQDTGDLSGDRILIKKERGRG